MRMQKMNHGMISKSNWHLNLFTRKPNMNLLKVILFLISSTLTSAIGNYGDNCTSSPGPYYYPDEVDCLHSETLLFCTYGQCFCLHGQIYLESLFYTKWDTIGNICIGIINSECDYDPPKPPTRARLNCDPESGLYCESRRKGDPNWRPPHGLYIQNGICHEDYEYTTFDFIMLGVFGAVFLIIVAIFVAVIVFLRRRRRKAIAEQAQQQTVVVQEVSHVITPSVQPQLYPPPQHNVDRMPPYNPYSDPAPGYSSVVPPPNPPQNSYAPLGFEGLNQNREILDKSSKNF